ncbi:MAG: YfiR family protein [Candidatus Sedimenticola sp. (ex Thyasira tokunagai)]
MVTPGLAAPPDEEALKAAYTLNFPKFIEWSNSPQNSLQICLVGDTRVTKLLNDAAGSDIAGRTLKTRRVQLPGQVEGCHVLYIAELEANRLRRSLAALAESPILTVSDLPGFVSAGGMIGLIRDGSRLRFEIDLKPMRRVGLLAEAKLIRLAVRVYYGGAVDRNPQ